MTSRPKPSAVVFAKDVAKLADFYAQVIGMTPAHGDQNHVVLDDQGFQLVIHGIPAQIAEQIVITVPPALREDTPIKVCLPVANIDAARQTAQELGGAIQPADRAWTARGFRACDGHDPEGNVFQVREPAA
jgi:predicted enzyme related to lactoylglutathione lyase